MIDIVFKFNLKVILNNKKYNKRKNIGYPKCNSPVIGSSSKDEFVVNCE